MANVGDSLRRLYCLQHRIYNLLVCAVRSAGGTGVLLNIDRLRGRLSSLAAGAKLRGIADSGWFLDNRPYRRLACSDALLCSPADSVRRGIR